MKTANPIIDTLVESQTQFVNSWMDSAKKMQSAFTSGNIASEGQSLYKEYFDKQMDILNTMKESNKDLFGADGQNNPQEFFKNWFNQQAAFAKQMTDFNQSINSSFTSFGKPAADYMANFGQSNTAFTNMYNSWLTTLNSTYDTLSKNMNGAFNKDIFANFMQGNQMFAKMQEFFQPMMTAMQKGQFDVEAIKNHFTAESYAHLSKQMFGNIYDQAAIKTMYDNAIKELHTFFASNNNLSKEYFSQIQNISKEFPQLFGNSSSATSLKEFYAQMNNVFGKTFEPVLKLVNAGKEKENIEAVISMMDRIAEYSVKQAELQAFLQSTAKAGVEKIAQEYAAKFSNPQAMTQVPTPQEMYNEWVKVNEQLYSELFATEEFSKVKGEALNLTNDIKKHFEKQFESTFSNFPVVFKSEVEELEKVVFDLKKQIKDLQNKLAMQTGPVAELVEEDKAGKSRKK
ncbi:MAG: poly(R)-hydroxyalkanoic acid synthase subunit PhaE [bacterium]|nr:poly(R)-hydroxyalkanoic acid synthase subunit PhaE [bacterium]